MSDESGTPVAPLPSGLAEVPVQTLVNAPERWRQRAALIVTERLHGRPCRATFRDGALHAGTAEAWVAPEDWPRGWLDLPPALALWLRDHPGAVVYGESYGPDASHGPRSLRCSDVWGPDGWWSWADLVASRLPLVPVLGTALWRGDLDSLAAWAHGPSSVPGRRLREGAVLRPLYEDAQSRTASARPFVTLPI